MDKKSIMEAIEAILTEQLGDEPAPQENTYGVCPDCGEDMNQFATQIAKRNALEYINSEPLDIEPTFKRYFDWLDKDGE